MFFSSVDKVRLGRVQSMAVSNVENVLAVHALLTDMAALLVQVARTQDAMAALLVQVSKRQNPAPIDVSPGRTFH